MRDVATQAASQRRPMNACPICGELKEIETSFSKYLAPEQDRPLPPAASQLVAVATPRPEAANARQIRRCPSCGALFEYTQSHEYMINGTEDEEELRRMPADEAAAFILDGARKLEALRRDIDDLQGAAGSLGDYIDRGRPSPAEEIESLEAMRRHSEEAAKRRLELRALVEALRNTCPEILATWAGAHQRVCRFFLASLPETGDDAQTARFVARSSLDAWSALPHQGETFISAPTVWLDSYLERLQEEFAKEG